MMSDFLFGFVWTAFFTPIFIEYLISPEEQNGGADKNPFMFIFNCAFELFGLYFLIRGLITIIKDKKTNKRGLECYGIIRNIQRTGEFNNKLEYKAIVNFINPETNELETLEENIGFNYPQYDIDTYVLCKYYQGNINIEKIIFEKNVPERVKKYLIPIGIEQNEFNEEEYNNIQEITSKMLNFEIIFKRIILGIIIAILFIFILFDIAIIKLTIKAKNYPETVATLIDKKNNEINNKFVYCTYIFKDKKGNNQEIVTIITENEIPQEQMKIKYNEDNPDEYYDESSIYDTSEFIWFVIRIIILILLVILFINKKLLMYINVSVKL